MSKVKVRLTPTTVTALQVYAQKLEVLAKVAAKHPCQFEDIWICVPAMHDQPKNIIYLRDKQFFLEEDEEDSSEPSRIDELPSAYRVALAPYVVELVEAIKDQSSGFTSSVERATSTIEQALSTLDYEVV